MQDEHQEDQSEPIRGDQAKKQSDGEGEGTQSNTQMIKKLEINYSAIDISQVFQERSMSHTILAFSYDRIAKNFIMVLKTEDQESQILGNNIYIFKIFSLHSNKVELSIQILNTALIGRLLSGLYTLLNGHLYFNNNVIKIRYDLLGSATTA